MASSHLPWWSMLAMALLAMALLGRAAVEEAAAARLHHGVLRMCTLQCAHAHCSGACAHRLCSRALPASKPFWRCWASQAGGSRVGACVYGRTVAGCAGRGWRAKNIFSVQERAAACPVAGSVRAALLPQAWPCCRLLHVIQHRHGKQGWMGAYEQQETGMASKVALAGCACAVLCTNWQ
jgi:hypothetical protein